MIQRKRRRHQRRGKKFTARPERRVDGPEEREQVEDKNDCDKNVKQHSPDGDRRFLFWRRDCGRLVLSRWGGLNRLFFSQRFLAHAKLCRLKRVYRTTKVMIMIRMITD